MRSTTNRQQPGAPGPEIWSSILEAITTATGWSALLVDEQGRIVRAYGVKQDQGEALSPTLAAAIAQVASSGGRRTLHEDSAAGQRVWMIVAANFAPPGWAIVAGGLPPSDGSRQPSIGEAEIQAAARVLDGILSAFGAVLSTAQRSYQESEARYEAEQRRSTALYEISALINAVHDTRSVVSAVLRETVRLFAADRAAVLLPDEGKQLICVDGVDMPPLLCRALGELVSNRTLDDGAASAQPFYSPRIADDPTTRPFQELAAHEGAVSMVLAPFVHRGELLGILALLHSEERLYSADELSAIAMFANQVAVALINARLFESSERRLRRSVLLAELGRRLNATLDQQQVLDALVTAAPGVLGEACALYLLRSGEPRLVPSACYDARVGSGERLRQILERPQLELMRHQIGRATAHGKWLMIGGPGDTRHDGLLVALGAHSYISVPLLLQGAPTGALVFWLFDEAQTFAPEDVVLAEEVADRAALALQNARLYETKRRADEFKDEFLASISHELRTPLTAIMGYSQLIRKTQDGSSGRFGKHMDIIWSQAQRLHRVVETVLDISNIQQGELALNPEPLDLAALLDTALEKVMIAAPRDIGFEMQIAQGPLPLLGDRLRLEQVFGHLLANAVKYSPPEGRVSVRLERDDDAAVVEIADHGPGIEADEIDQLFSRYFKGESPLSRSGGLGLGLYISRAFVEAHGGTISVRSSPGAGAVFRVALPLTAIVQQQAEDPQRDTAPSQ